MMAIYQRANFKDGLACKADKSKATGPDLMLSLLNNIGGQHADF